MPTLVAVRMAPTNAASIMLVPNASASAAPAMNGRMTPPQAARNAARPTWRIAAMLVSSPAIPRIASAPSWAIPSDRAVGDEDRGHARAEDDPGADLADDPGKPDDVREERAGFGSEQDDRQGRDQLVQSRLPGGPVLR